ncbi:MAG: ArnT family glycosyltransferase [bacterium]
MIGIALMVRLWGINYGLPEIKYIDAEKTLLPAKKIALNILTGNWNIDPQKYQYPTVYINLMAIEFIAYGAIYGVINTHLGRHRSFKEAIQALYTAPERGYLYRAVPSAFHLLARITSAIAGALTVLFVFLIGKTAFEDKRIGLVSALFLAFMFGHVKDSRFPMTDATMCLLGIIGLYYLSRISVDDQLKDHVLCGVFIGLGISTKYFPGFFIITYLIIIAPKLLEGLKNKKANLMYYKKPLAGFLMIFVFFLVGTPIFLVRYNKYLGIGTGGVVSELQSQAGGKIGYTQNWYFDLLFSRFPINNEPLAAQSHLSVMGGPLLFFLICGIIYALYLVLTNKSKNRWFDIGICITVILFYMFLAGEGKKKLIRYFYFLYPVYTVIAARFITEMVDFFFKEKRWNKSVLVVASIVFVFPTGMRTVRLNYLQSHIDSRLIAGKWFERNIPQGSKVFAPILYPPIISTVKYDVSYYRGESMRDLNPTVALLKRAGFEYIITSSYDTSVFYSPDAMKHNPELTFRWRGFYDSLDDDAELIMRFESNLIDKPGPEIKIYRVP